MVDVTKRYRPSLPSHLILKMLELAKLEQPMSMESVEIIGILAPFQAKIANGAITPSSVSMGKVSTLESLGGAEPTPAVYTLNEVIFYTKESYWQACHDKYLNDAASCCLEEIQAAKEHAYVNDLMSPEEAAAFEEGDSNGS